MKNVPKETSASPVEDASQGVKMIFIALTAKNATKTLALGLVIIKVNAAKDFTVISK